MKLKNLTQDEACQTLLTILPKEAKDLLHLFNDIGMPDVALYKLECLQAMQLGRQQITKGEELYAWVYFYQGIIYFACPGQEQAFAAREESFCLKGVKIGQSVPMTYQNSLLQSKTEMYRLISTSDGKPRFIPEWWLNVSKVVDYYFCNAKNVKHRLQQIHIGQKKMLAWRLISLKPVSVQWFVIENGTFLNACDLQKNYGSLAKEELAFELNNGIITFK